MNNTIYYEDGLISMGYKGKFTNVAHIEDLKNDIFSLKAQGRLNDKIYDDYLQFDFESHKEFKSIAIIAMKLPVVKVAVEKDNQMKEVMIPSAYYSGGKVETFDRDIELFFHENKVNYRPIHLPCKLLVARTGLGDYGRNNIAYIDGFGSYFRTRAFLTDIELREDNWHEVKQNPKCHSCTICINSCPNQLISKGDYLIDAGKCLTFPNEISGDFPSWVKPAWHNALVGCMKCQDNCPNNIEHHKDIQVISTLTKEHVSDIFQNTNFNELQIDTKDTIRAFEFDDYYDVFKRNLEAVYHNL